MNGITKMMGIAAIGTVGLTGCGKFDVAISDEVRTKTIKTDIFSARQIDSIDKVAGSNCTFAEDLELWDSNLVKATVKKSLKQGIETGKQMIRDSLANAAKTLKK